MCKDLMELQVFRAVPGTPGVVVVAPVLVAPMALTAVLVAPVAPVLHHLVLRSML